MRTVYVDLLFLINFSMDLLCLLLVSKILFRKFSYPRSIAAAALGGTYSVALLFLPSLGGMEAISHILCCVLINLVAFAKKEDTFLSLITNSAAYGLTSMLLGGIMTAAFNLLNNSGIDLEGAEANDIPPWLLLSVGGVSAITTLVGGRYLRRRASGRTAEIKVSLCGKTQTINAMCDSGNLLKDCVSGKPVIVIDEKYIPSLLGLHKQIDIDALAKLDSELALKVSLIPYSTASGSKTMVAFRPEKLLVTSKTGETEVNALVGFAKINCAAYGCFALIPPELI